MKLKLIALLSLFAISTSSFAALEKMSDEEMSGEAIEIFGGVIDEKTEKLLLEGFKMNDAQVVEYVREVNSLAAAIQRGEVTEKNFMNYFSSHLSRLELIGVPHEILMYQANIALRAQQEALRAEQQLAMQRALFQRFTSELTRVANDFRNNPNATITIRLDYIFANIPNVDINQVIRDSVIRR